MQRSMYSILRFQLISRWTSPTVYALVHHEAADPFQGQFMTKAPDDCGWDAWWWHAFCQILFRLIGSNHC
jgi:hypothetical protein